MAAAHATRRRAATPLAGKIKMPPVASYPVMDTLTIHAAGRARQLLRIAGDLEIDPPFGGVEVNFDHSPRRFQSQRGRQGFASPGCPSALDPAPGRLHRQHTVSAKSGIHSGRPHSSRSQVPLKTALGPFRYILRPKIDKNCDELIVVKDPNHISAALFSGGFTAPFPDSTASFV